MILGVHVKPNARTTRVVGWADARTVILAIAAPPVDGKANDEVVRFLAKTLGLPRSSVTIERGATARVKHVSLPDGTDLAALNPVG
ncbi:MAG: DUF167 domain-containing protein [Myxococcota bacterium]